MGTACNGGGGRGLTSISLSRSSIPNTPPPPPEEIETHGPFYSIKAKAEKITSHLPGDNHLFNLQSQLLLPRYHLRTRMRSSFCGAFLETVARFLKSQAGTASPWPVPVWCPQGPDTSGGLGRWRSPFHETKDSRQLTIGSKLEESGFLGQRDIANPTPCFPRHRWSFLKEKGAIL